MQMQKKAPEVGNQSKLEEKSETSEQRLWRNTRLLKSLAIGTTLLAAGMSGVEARPEPSGSALQRQGHDNTTGLTHAFNQQEFNNLSHPTALEFNPYTYKVTPELLDHLRKVGVPDPKQHIRNVQQGIYDGETSSEQREQEKPLSSNEKKIAAMRALMEKAKTDPEVMGRARKLLAESRPPSEQESSELERRQLNPSDYCLQIALAKGFPTMVEVAEGSVTGQGIMTDYNLNVVNDCYGTVHNVQFSLAEVHTCPGDCQPSNSGVRVFEDVPGNPNTIGDKQVAEGHQPSLTYCIKSDSNGEPTDFEPPMSITASVAAKGYYNNQPETSPVHTFSVYP